MEKTLAKLILRAQDRASANKDDRHYTVCREAAKLTCEEYNQPALFEPVYLMIAYGWNDIQAWATEQLEMKTR